MTIQNNKLIKKTLTANTRLFALAADVHLAVFAPAFTLSQGTLNVLASSIAIGTQNAHNSVVDGKSKKMISHCESINLLYVKK